MMNLKLSSVVKILVGGSILSLQVACMQTVIVFKPSPFLDPLPDQTRTAATEEKADPKVDEQWNLAKVGFTPQSATSSDFAGNYNVKIAILSTGIDYNHEDLIGQVAINRKEITNQAAGEKPGVNRKDDDNNGLVDDVVGWDFVDGDGFAYDRHGAGTAVAGIIAARQNNGKGITGLMRNVTLYPIRYIEDHGPTSIAN
jgi:subtilisin family serine protease